MAIISEMWRLPRTCRLSSLREESSEVSGRNAAHKFAQLKNWKLTNVASRGRTTTRELDFGALEVRVIETGQRRNQSNPLMISGAIVQENLISHGSELDPELYLKERLVALRNGTGPGNEAIVFPASFSARDRRRGHEIAERLGLGHVSSGQGKDRCLTAWRLSVTERLSELRRLLDLEEEASRTTFLMDQPVQSWRVLEAQGIFLHKALILEREAASFGKERWILQDRRGEASSDCNAPFFQRSRPGMAICLAETDASGNCGAAKGEPSGRIAWSRGQKCCVIFDHAPSVSEQVRLADLLLVPDTASFQRMRSVIIDCDMPKWRTNLLLHALLGTGLKCLSRSIPMSSRTEDPDLNGISSRVLNVELPKVELLDHGLNAEQHAAVKLCTEPSESPVVLIHGPFGTGKTRTLVEVVRQHEKAGRRVLVCAASNAAVDNMAQALLSEDRSLALARAGMSARVSTAVASHTVEALQDSRPETGVARKLRREAYAMELASEKWTRSGSGGQKRRYARNEVRTLFKDIRRLENLAAAHVLKRTKVLCGTLTGFASALSEGDPEDKFFDCAVVDEASQAITPALLLLLPYLKRSEADSPNVPSIVMAGDHQQLTPTVLSGDGMEIGVGLEATLFEELMERDGGGLGTRIDSSVSHEKEWENFKMSILSRAHALASGTEIDMDQAYIKKRVVSGGISVALRQQYRMPKQLMAFPSAAFYGGELLARHSNVSIIGTNEVGILQSGSLLEVIDTAGAGFEEEKTGASLPASAESKAAIETFSTRNPGQAKLTVRIVHELLSSGSNNPADLGVVTPYSAQVTLLRQLLSNVVDQGLEIDSVDAYQGREKKVIILDAVRSNPDGSTGFLSDSHRLNVALTRASHKLIVIGDSATLSTCPVWGLLFEWVCREHQLNAGVRYQSSFEIPLEDSW